MEGSLRRLRTDYLDLYQYHVPDGVTPIEETLSALTELVREGKVRYLGSSNVPGWRIAEAAHVARAGGHSPFVSTQTHWSLLERGAEREVVPAAVHYGVGVLPFFPLAHGLLTGKVRRGQEPPPGTRLARLPTSSRRRGWSGWRRWRPGAASTAGPSWRWPSAPWPRCPAAVR
ncbi:aldo/keto reductase [Nonomuraea thailandensis]